VHAALSDFVEPDWRAPIDIAKAIEAIPEARTISGMFLEPAAREARRLNKPLTSARERYVAFRFYPLREHAKLLHEACLTLFPGVPLRMGLRKLGRAAPAALLTSTLGRATVGVAQGTLAIMDAMAKAYAINVPGSQVSLVDPTERSCLLRVRSLPFFLDCHHVGAFEGVLRYAGVEGEVRVRTLNREDADYFCVWR
jgi:uncharacterized protein (TIGR02265 family)